MSSPNSSQSRFWKFLKGLVTVLLILVVLGIVGLQVYIHRYFEPLVMKRLNAVIVKGSDSLYSFHLAKLDINFWGKTVELDSLFIQVDSTHYSRLAKQKELPSLTAEVILDKGAITGIQLYPLIFKRQIVLDQIVSENAKVILSRHFRTDREQDSVSAEEPAIPLWQSLQPDINNIAIDRIVLDNLNLSYKNADSATAFRWDFENCDAIIQSVRVDSSSAADTTRILYTKDISIAFNDVNLRTTDSLYEIKAAQIAYSTQKNSVLIDSFKLRPLLEPVAFYKKRGMQGDYFNIGLDHFKIYGFHLPRWINDNTLDVDSMHMSNPDIRIYSDKTAPPDNSSKVGKYPHQELSRLPFNLNVHVLKMENANISYREHSALTGETATLPFTALEGTITNLTNDQEAIARDNVCKAKFTGNILSRGNISALFSFYLGSSNGEFAVDASVTRLDAAQLSPVFSALAKVDIESVNISRIDYHLKGSNYVGIGNVRMLYDDLKIVLTKEKKNGKTKKRRLLNFLVNNIVTYDSNPNKKGERQANGVRYQRVASKSFFNLVWKTMFEGMQDIIMRVDIGKKK